VNPEYDLAFSRLKNAGVMPVWMELDGEVRRLSEALDAFLERSVVYLTQQRALLVRRLHADAQPVTAEPAPAWPWWQVWRPLLAWFRMPAEPVEEPEPGPRSTGELIQLREHIRAQYLERAAELDKKIAEYHNALPQNLTNLQRLRRLPDRAARRFDARLPIGFVLDAATDTGKDEDTPTP
jgi:hypothetical protein